MKPRESKKLSSDYGEKMGKLPAVLYNQTKEKMRSPLHEIQGISYI